MSADEPRPADLPASEASHDPRPARRDALGAVLVVLAVLTAAVATRIVRILSPQPTVTQCEALLDRYVEHASRQHDPAVDDQDIAHAIGSSREEPKRDADVQDCRRRLSAAQVTCALECHDVDAIERCLQ
jgi:hypothetical protein